MKVNFMCIYICIYRLYSVGLGDLLPVGKIGPFLIKDFGTKKLGVLVTSLDNQRKIDFGSSVVAILTCSFTTWCCVCLKQGNQ